MSRWYCEDCARKRSGAWANPCPACCGFTALDDDLRGQIGDAVIALNRNPIFDLARTVSPEFAAAMQVLEDVAAGEAS